MPDLLNKGVPGQGIQDCISVACPFDCGYGVRLRPSVIETNLRGHLQQCPYIQELRKGTSKPVSDVDSSQGQTILDEAAHLVDGPREAHYGHPYDDFSRVIGAFNALFTDYLKQELEVRHWPLIMQLCKISREINEPKKDNWVDMAGYARTLEKLFEKRGIRVE